MAEALQCSIEVGDSLGNVGARTVVGTLRMVRMVRLLAVKRSAVIDCGDNVHIHQNWASEGASPMGRPIRGTPHTRLFHDQVPPWIIVRVDYACALLFWVLYHVQCTGLFTC